MLAQKDRQERDPGLQKGLELRDAITEQHKEERGQLKDLRVTAFVSVLIPRSLPEAISEGFVLARDTQGIYLILGVPRQLKWSHRSPPSALWPSTESLLGTSAITPGTAGINL